MAHIDAMQNFSARLNAIGHETLLPNMRETSMKLGDMAETERYVFKNKLMREHLAKIASSDAVLIFNEEKNGVSGYIGGNTLMEMAFAFSKQLPIFLLRDTPDASYKEEILGTLPVIINGDVTLIR